MFRTGQRFGAVHLIDVLLGKRTERVTQFKHDQLSVFGVGVEHPETVWRGIFRQLVATGLLSVDMEGYGGFSLNEASRAVLKGEQAVTLREDIEKPKKTRGERSADRSVGQARKRGVEIADDDEALWQALRDERTRIAKEQGVPPYVIFHDATLLDILQRRPQNEAEFALISGVGATKLTRYGRAFIEVIRAF